jgi:cysteine protease ATG4
MYTPIFHNEDLDPGSFKHLFSLGPRAPPVLLSGKEYYIKTDSDYNKLIHQFKRLYLMTYRKDFAPLLDTAYTSDAGWGCMIRSAQMLLATALSLVSATPDEDILPLFLDAPDAVYSIHNVCRVGLEYGMAPGEWYGPSNISKVMKDLVSRNRKTGGGKLAVYVSKDNVVYVNEVESLMCSDGKSKQSSPTVSPTSRARRDSGGKGGGEPLETDTADIVATSIDSILTSKHTVRTPSLIDPLLSPPSSASSKGSWDSPLLLLVPVRLGPTDLNETYVPSLLALISLPQSLGFIGGKPSSAYYFPGYQDNTLMFLDPHTVQQSVTAEQLRVNPPKKSYQPWEVRTMPVNKIDPSLSFAFLCNNSADFTSLREKINELNEKGKNPIFTIEHVAPSYDKDTAIADLLGQDGDGTSLTGDSGDDDDGFVVL